MADFAAQIFSLGASLNRQRAKEAVAEKTARDYAREQAIASVRERLDVTVYLAQNPDYPIERHVELQAQAIVDAVLGLTGGWR